MRVSELKKILNKYSDDEQIVMGDFWFTNGIKKSGKDNGYILTDSDIDEIINRFEYDYHKSNSVPMLEHYINEIGKRRMDIELNNIERWLHTTTEPYDDLDWDGEELIIYNETMSIGLDGMEVSDRYTRQDLESEGVL